MSKHVEYKVEGWKMSGEVPERAAIHIEQAQEDDGTRVTISDCLIAMDGFEPLTDAVRQLSARLTLLGWSFFCLVLLVAFVVAT